MKAKTTAGKAGETYIERELEGRLEPYMKRREIIAIVGARQCGKTTLMKRLFGRMNNAKFISFEDRDTLQLFSGEPKVFARKFVEGTDTLFIDEFQYAKDGGKNLKFLYDTYGTKFIISGSSVSELSVHGIRYLVGRILAFTLFPLSFAEYLRYRDPSLYGSNGNSPVAVRLLTQHYKDYVTYGGYPAVVLAETTEEKRELLRNVVNTCLLREVKEILQIADDARVSALIKALALQVGGVASYQELSSLTGFPYAELMRYLTILKKTFVCLESRPFFTNRRKELVKAPRFYFVDCGFRNSTIQSFGELEERPDRGQLNENFVATELAYKGYELRYWRTKTGAEVDFVIEKEGRPLPVEVKTTLRV